MTAQWYNGKRLSYDTHLCTVRFHGEIPGTKGEWLGVEWDDPVRGKHSGEHQGKQIFECLHPSPTIASFVRPARKSDPPRSFVQALKFKYAFDPTSEEHEDPDTQIVFTTKKTPWNVDRPIKFSGKVAEEVGFDKIRKQLAQLEELKIIILDGLCMWRPEARGNAWIESNVMDDVSKACPKAVELDLSRNLFEEWREVAAICEQLDRLRSLRVE